MTHISKDMISPKYIIPDPTSVMNFICIFNCLLLISSSISFISLSVTCPRQRLLSISWNLLFFLDLLSQLMFIKLKSRRVITLGIRNLGVFFIFAWLLCLFHPFSKCPSPLTVCLFSVWVCFCFGCLFIRFHIYVKSYGICLSLTGLFHLM